jgi:hypothetical protein
MYQLKHSAAHRTVSLSAIYTVVAHSAIVAAGPVHPLARFPNGFERADINILNWIVAAGAAHQPLSFAN